MGHGTDWKAYACRSLGLSGAGEACMLLEGREWDKMFTSKVENE